MRPMLRDLGPRRPPPLHRTFPTWGRDVEGDTITWRIYAPHRFGGAIVSHVILPASTSRGSAAAMLRHHRRIIWGRPVGDLPEIPVKHDQPAQGALF